MTSPQMSTDDVFGLTSADWRAYRDAASPWPNDTESRKRLVTMRLALEQRDYDNMVQHGHRSMARRCLARITAPKEYLAA